jgi:hypothetical protein
LILLGTAFFSKTVICPLKTTKFSKGARTGRARLRRLGTPAACHGEKAEKNVIKLILLLPTGFRGLTHFAT